MWQQHPCQGILIHWSWCESVRFGWFIQVQVTQYNCPHPVPPVKLLQSTETALWSLSQLQLTSAFPNLVVHFLIKELLCLNRALSTLDLVPDQKDRWPRYRASWVRQYPMLLPQSNPFTGPNQQPSFVSPSLSKQCSTNRTGHTSEYGAHIHPPLCQNSTVLKPECHAQSASLFQHTICHKNTKSSLLICQIAQTNKSHAWWIPSSSAPCSATGFKAHLASRGSDNHAQQPASALSLLQSTIWSQPSRDT